MNDDCLIVDLRECGIGNVVLLAAAHLLECMRRNAVPVLLHDAPEELAVLDLDYFTVVHPESIVGDDLPRYANKRSLCNRETLQNPVTARCMRDIVRRRDDVPEDLMKDVEAGFCFRVSIPELDGPKEFMNDLAVRSMLREMSAYKKVFVCGNNEDMVREAVASHPHAVYIPIENTTTRNADSHIVQWHALSRCPAVYHGVRQKGMGTTSTFAPVAAVFGNAGDNIFGIDNAGNVYHGPSYGWA